jgi:hypothetical protein
MEEMDLLAADGEALSQYFHSRKWIQTSERAVIALRDDIVAQVRRGEPERIRVAQREAASKAWDVSLRSNMYLDAYLDREYPDPAPSVMMSNGERVTFDGKVRYRGWTWDTVAAFVQRDNEKGYVLTDSEIRELLALAATVEGR